MPTHSTDHITQLTEPAAGRHAAPKRLQAVVRHEPPGQPPLSRMPSLTATLTLTAIRVAIRARRRKDLGVRVLRAVRRGLWWLNVFGAFRRPPMRHQLRDGRVRQILGGVEDAAHGDDPTVPITRWLYGADLWSGHQTSDDSQHGHDRGNVVVGDVQPERGHDGEHGLGQADEQGERPVDGHQRGRDRAAGGDEGGRHDADDLAGPAERGQHGDEQSGDGGDGHDRFAPDQPVHEVTPEVSAEVPAEMAEVPARANA